MTDLYCLQSTWPSVQYAQTPEGNQRLRTLYSILPGIPDERFDLINWRTYVATDWGSVNDEKILNGCGAVGCAVGFACGYPEFKAQGLEYCGQPAFSSADGSLHLGWRAVENFFGLTEEQAECLFKAHFYQVKTGRAARLEVMRRIRTLLLARGVITAERNADLAEQEAKGLMPV